ncbi:MAG: hypothetical protein JWR90_7 [Marmoricola sp.]|jgi:hypothetical protein|nr:hypothetical protein [Marmoricola sp.]
MRHRGETDETNRPQAGHQTSHQTGQQHEPGRLLTLTELMATEAPVHGKHRATPSPIPAQKLPTHDAPGSVIEVPVAAPVEAVLEAAPPALSVAPRIAPVFIPAQSHVRVVPTAKPGAEVVRATVPHEAHWKASHVPRVVAAALLALSVAGTAGLGVRFADSRTSDDFLSLVIGFVTVVVLWALVIASTPQVVRLSGSVLTVHDTSGSETFDLADGLQPVDVVGDPRTSHWAVLLHRPNGTTQVLRRSDVDPVELDPIVRHYRNVATQRLLDRDARFNL